MIRAIGARAHASRAGIVTFLVATLVMVAAGEAFFRWREAQQPVADRFVDHPVLGWIGRPGHEFTVRGAEFVVTDRVNAIGLLGPDVAREKPPGTFRVVALGDSMTEGVQVPHAQRSVALLEAGIAMHTGGRVEVLNAGVTNYQTDQEVLLYETELRSLKADLVLLFLFTGNDVMGNLSAQRQPGEGRALRPRFVLAGGELVLQTPAPDPSGRIDAFGARVEPEPESALARARSSLYRSSAFYRVLADALYVLRAPAEAREAPFGWRLFTTRPDPTVEDAWAVTAALLRRLRDDAARDGARLGVVVLPDAIQVDQERWRTFIATYALSPAEWSPDDASVRACRTAADLGIACLDVLATMREAGGTLYFPRDGHLTAAGHRVVADAVLRWIGASGLR